jgi:diguanylate cyclase (GGDEF)-like protein
MPQVPEDIAVRLKTCTSFPSPPPVAMQVIELAQNPEIDLGTVADAVSGDPAIAAKVMRIANSALYARRRQSSNLRQALIVLGLNATLTLALSFTLVATLRKSPPQGFDFNSYWRRAIVAATWGKLLASELGRRDAEEIFLGCLLQDIGMLAIDKIAPEVYEGISPFQLEHGRVAQHEKTQIDTDHRAIGAHLLDDWNMPENLVRCVSHSHDMSAAGVDPEYKGFVRVVAMSSELADLWFGNPTEISIRRAGQDAHRHLGILPNRLAEMFDVIREQLPVAESIFEMDLFDEDYLQDITDTAREILMIRNLHTLTENRDLEAQKSQLESQNTMLQHEASSDGLTGVFNRRYFEESVEKEFATATRHSWPLSVIFVDVDKFKQINDNHGHQSGDLILREVASLLRQNVRESDTVARYGGDEFVLLLPGLARDGAEKIAERMIADVRKKNVTGPDGQAVKITLSLGIATYDSDSGFADSAALLAAADEAVYHSKRSGRDRLTSYDAIKAA